MGELLVYLVRVRWRRVAPRALGSRVELRPAISRTVRAGVHLRDGRSARAAASRSPASRSCLAGPKYASVWAPARGSRSEVVSEAGGTDIVRDVGQQSRYLGLPVGDN